MIGMTQKQSSGNIAVVKFTIIYLYCVQLVIVILNEMRTTDGNCDLSALKHVMKVPTKCVSKETLLS